MSGLGGRRGGEGLSTFSAPKTFDCHHRSRRSCHQIRQPTPTERRRLPIVQTHGRRRSHSLAFALSNSGGGARRSGQLGCQITPHVLALFLALLLWRTSGFLTPATPTLRTGTTYLSHRSWQDGTPSRRRRFRRLALPVPLFLALFGDIKPDCKPSCSPRSSLEASPSPISCSSSTRPE